MPADLRGLKIRTPADPATIDTFQALGAATQQINFSELYVALQQGVVDGQENPLANIHSAKLHEVNRFISLSGHKWECSPVHRLAHRLGPAERGRPQADHRGRAGGDRAQPAADGRRATTKLLAEYRANPAVAVNEVEQDAFRAATAPVLDKWEQRPFGDFVKRLRAAAGGLTWSSPFHTAPAAPGEAVVLPGPRARAAPLLIAADKVDRGRGPALPGRAAVTGIVLMGVLTANVIARYVLATGGFDWAEEVPEQLFPWFIMAGVALAVQHGGHIAVEWLLGQARARRQARRAARRPCAGGRRLRRSCAGRRWWWPTSSPIERSPALGLPKTYGYWAIAAGCVLLALSHRRRSRSGSPLIGPEAMPQPSPEEMPT